MSDTPLLRHIAIIPDGNRRWARQQGIFGSLKMYDQGGEAASDVIKVAFEQGVEYVSFWGGSESNLTSRNGAEVAALERIYSILAKRLVEEKEVHEKQVRVEVVGRWQELLSEDTANQLQFMIDATKNYDAKVLTLLIGYDGEAERSVAVEKLLRENEAADGKSGSELLREASWTGALPEVDLIIRTGSWLDPHNSAGFLSLLTNDSQYAFPEVLWPDFTKDMMQDIMDDFLSRERRYGK